MKQLWRLPFFIVAWILFVAIKLPTIFLGFVVVPFMYAYNDVMYDRLPNWMRPWANPEDWLGGPQSFDGSLPKWWVDKKGKGFTSFYHYHAWRNPANGLRSYERLDLDIVMAKVKYLTPLYMLYYEPWQLRTANRKIQESHPDVASAIIRKTISYICWQGFRAGIKLVHLWPDVKRDIKIWKWTLLKAGPRHLVIKFGWRVEPRDATTPIDPGGIRVDDSGFASKFLFYRKG